MTNRDFKGVFIPREVWLDKRLALLDKFILTEIRSIYIDPEESCTEYLASFCGCSEGEVLKSIEKLVELGYITNVDA